MTPRILIASIVHQHPDVLKAHLETVRWQEGNFDVELRYIVDVSDPNRDANIALLDEAGVGILPSQPKSDDATYHVNEYSHEWSITTFYWLAQEKQRLLEVASKGHFDAVLLLDSDLLLEPGTLKSLWNADKDVVSAVFWTRWTPDAPPLPQVWMSHPYEFQGRGVEAHEFLSRLANRYLVRVAGLGACTLIRRNVLDRVAYWPPIKDLPTWGMWQGEDRHFCIRAERNHVELWADAWPNIVHVYRPEQRSKIDEYLVHLRRQTEASEPRIGDLVSFTLEPCEEPALARYQEHVRGRLGALRLLPEIESALLNMRAGEERFLNVTFPYWYEIPQYRNQRRLLRLRLLDAKSYALPPGLEVNPQTICDAFYSE